MNPKSSSQNEFQSEEDILQHASAFSVYSFEFGKMNFGGQPWYDQIVLLCLFVFLLGFSSVILFGTGK